MYQYISAVCVTFYTFVFFTVAIICVAQTTTTAPALPLLSVNFTQNHVWFAPNATAVDISTAHTTSPNSTAFDNVVILGQSASFSGGAWEPGPAFNKGLLAALWEYNEQVHATARAAANSSSSSSGSGAQVPAKPTIFLRTLDDQYDVQRVAPNVAALVAVPHMFAFVGFMGSPTTSAALPLLNQHRMPLIAPLTGSAVFRKTFNPYTIHVRAGYDDEALDMVKLFVTTKHLRRISVIYQDDAFGTPAKDAILAALKRLNMAPLGVHAYNKVDIPTTDFRAYALNVWQAGGQNSTGAGGSSNPQGIILYAVEGFSNAFLSAFYDHIVPLYAPAASAVDFITGSWIGDGNRLYIERNPTIDAAHFYQTQVLPHPVDSAGTHNLTRQYQQALRGRQAWLAAMAQQRNVTLGLYERDVSSFDYLSYEGYLAGRLIGAALDRTPRGVAAAADGPLPPHGLARSAFLNAIYDTKMFTFAELLAGPYNQDCQYDPGTAKGRSSLCYCNQGLRTVETTVLANATATTPVTSTTAAATATSAPATAVYDYRPVDNRLQYPITECYATSDVVTAPKVFAALTTADHSPSRDAARRFSAGLTTVAYPGALKDTGASVVAIALRPNTTTVAGDLAAEATRRLRALGGESLLIGGISLVPVPTTAATASTAASLYPLFPLLSTLPTLFGQGKDIASSSGSLPSSMTRPAMERTHIHLLPTLEQEIFTLCEQIAAAVTALASAAVANASAAAAPTYIHLLLHEDMDDNVATAVDWALETFDLPPARRARFASENSTSRRSGSAVVASLAAVITATIGTAADPPAHIIMLGLADASTAAAAVGILQRAGPARQHQYYLAFNDVATYWGLLVTNATQASAASDAAEHGYLRRLFFVTNLPHWTAAALSATTTSGSLATSYQAALQVSAGGLQQAGIRPDDPLLFVGYYFSRVIEFILDRTNNGDTAPQTVLFELYRTSVIAIEDLTLGPFVDIPCDTHASQGSAPSAAEDRCLCNVGPRAVFARTAGDIVSASAPTGAASRTSPRAAFRFETCRVQYSLKSVPVPSMVATIATAAVVPTISAILFTFLLRAFCRYRKVRYAPRPEQIAAQRGFHTIIIALKRETALSERYPYAMPHVIKRYHAIVGRACGAHRCYLVKALGGGGAVVVCSTSNAAILRCAAACSKALQFEPWHQYPHRYDDAVLLDEARHAAGRGGESEGEGSVSRTSSAFTGARSSAVSSPIHNGLFPEIGAGSATGRSHHAPRSHSRRASSGHTSALQSADSSDNSASHQHSHHNHTDRRAATDRSRNPSTFTTSIASHQHPSAALTTTLACAGPIPFEFSVGVHFSTGQAFYDADGHRYDYTGPSVDGAAIAADRAHGGQILVSSAVNTTDVFEEENYIDYCHLAAFPGMAHDDCDRATAKRSKKRTRRRHDDVADNPLEEAQHVCTLRQLNQPGIVWRVFPGGLHAVSDAGLGEGGDGQRASDDLGKHVDSVAASLEQQNTGVTAKKVTVLALYCHALDAVNEHLYQHHHPSSHHNSTGGGVYFGLPRDAFAKRVAAVTARIYEIAASEKGFVHAIVGPRVIISFNAVAATPQAPRRAYNVFHRLKEEMLALVSGHAHHTAPIVLPLLLSGGIAIDTTLVGNLAVAMPASLNANRTLANMIKGIGSKEKADTCEATVPLVAGRAAETALRLQQQAAAMLAVHSIRRQQQQPGQQCQLPRRSTGAEPRGPVPVPPEDAMVSACFVFSHDAEEFAHFAVYQTTGITADAPTSTHALATARTLRSFFRKSPNAAGIEAAAAAIAPPRRLLQQMLRTAQDKDPCASPPSPSSPTAAAAIPAPPVPQQKPFCSADSSSSSGEDDSSSGSDGPSSQAPPFPHNPRALRLPKVRALTNIVRFKCAPDGSGDGPCDEWMYELQQGDAKHGEYSKGNALYARLVTMAAQLHKIDQNGAHKCDKSAATASAGHHPHPYSALEALLKEWVLECRAFLAIASANHRRSTNTVDLCSGGGGSGSNGGGGVTVLGAAMKEKSVALRPGSLCAVPLALHDLSRIHCRLAAATSIVSEFRTALLEVLE